MGADATIVSASLDDKELKASINSMVESFNEGLKQMKQDTNDAVAKINESLKNVGRSGVNIGVNEDGGSRRRAKVQQEETKAVDATSESYDRLLGALQMVQRQVKMYQGRTWFSQDDMKSYENAIKRVAELQEKLDAKTREMALGNIMKHQGVTDMREYITSLMKPNESLKRLNDDYKEWEKTSKHATQAASVDFENYSNKILRQAEIVRERMRQSQEGFALFGNAVIYDPSLKKGELSIEEQLVRAHERSAQLAQERLYAQRQITTAVQQENVAHGSYDGQFDSVQQMQQKSNEFVRLSNEVKTVSRDYSELESIVARYVGTESQEVVVLNNAESSYALLSESLKKMRSAYAEMTASERSSNNGEELAKNIQTVERAISKISSQMQRPMTLFDVASLPEASIDDISYKIKMLRSYIQGINLEEGVGQEKVRYASDELEKLSNKLREIQKTTTQITVEANAANFDKIAKMPTENIIQVNKQIVEIKKYIDSLKNQPVIDDKNLSKAENLLESVVKKAEKLKSVLGTRENILSIDEMPVRTLDDIAKKIQRIQAIRMNLDVDKNAKDIKDLNLLLEQLHKKQREILGENKTLLESNNALARSFNYMKNRLAFYFTVGASTQFVKQLVDIRSQYEMNERALGILIDSAEKGTQVFNELSAMSLVSPYTLIELTNAAKQLTAYGVAARDVVDTTRRLADIAAAVGAPIERISYALGHIQTYGYLTSLQARQFANSGIPLVKELAARYSELEGRVITTADVYDRMKKKQVEYADVLDVINTMKDEGGTFFDFQAKMADTLKVRLANLNLAWNNMLNDMGKSSQGLLTWTIGSLRTLFTHWKQLDQAIKSAAWAGGLIVAVRALNVLLVKAGADFALLSKSMTATQIAGKGIASTFHAVWGSLKTIVTSPLTWWSLLAFAIVDATRDLKNLNEAQKEFNKSLREAGDNNLKTLSDFYKQYEGGAKEISNEDAEKIWGEMREQIELTVKKSDEFIGSLLKINDISKRLNAGFELIKDISEVNAALKELDDDTIKIAADFSKWWNLNLWPDGLIENIKNYTKSLKEYDSYKQLATNNAHEESLWKEQKEQLDKLEGSILTTTESLRNFIQLKGWEGNINKINTLYDQVFGNIAERFNLSPSEAFNMQMAAEKERSIATEKALQIRLDDVRAALKRETDENVRYELMAERGKLEQEFFFFVKNTDKSRVYWRDFTNWIKTQHLSETQAMFRGMDAQQIKALDFQKGEYFAWVDELAHKYAKEHNLAYKDVFDTLKNYITSANQMSIFIPLVIGTNKEKSVYEQLTEADQKADTAFQKIERLKKRIEELDKGKGVSSVASENVEEYNNALKELEQAERDYNDALKEGGHSKKEDKANKKAQTEAESELQKALKEEIQLLDKARSVYKQLTKEGVESNRALAISTEGYGETITHINSVLQKYGIQKFNLAAYAGVQSPHAIMELLQGQLDTLLKSGVAKPEEIKDLQVKLKDVKVDEVTFNQKTLTDSLNNELGKLKDEYELAVELDANPELGGIFADMMGLSKEEIESLPRDFESVVRKMQSIMDDQLGVGRFDVRSNLNKKMFEQWLNTNNIDLESSLGQRLNAFVEQGNKIRQDESKEQVEEWNKLLEKYATYEYKKMQIQIQYEKEMREARKKGANADIMQSIENWRKEQHAQLELEQFQKTPDWIVATGDLAGLSNQALQMLIDSINKYKRAANNLTPKQIKQINDALKKLRDEQRKDNPLAKLSILFDEVASKAADYETNIDKLTKRYDELNKKQVDGENLTAAERKEFSSLGITILDLKDKLKEVKKVSAVDLVDALNSIEKTATQAGGAIAEMIEAFGDKESADALKNIMSAFDKAADWAKMGAAIAGPWGAAIGAVAGLVTGMASFLAESISGNAKITKQVEASERNLKRLESTFSSLEAAANNAYGAVVEGLQRATVESKKLQLAEIQRQLQLEQSRKEKYKDEDKIIDLQSKVRDLRREIEEGSQDIINNLLNISSAGDGVTQLVQTMIDAFRNGEDAMEAFGNKWDEMIDNMILKLIVTEYMQRGWDKLMENLNNMEDKFLGKISQDKAQAQSVLESMEGLTKEEQKKAMADFLGIQSLVGAQNVISDEALESFINAMKAQLENAAGAIDQASIDFDKWALEYMSTEGKSFMENWAKGVSDILPEYYTFGENNAAQLSNLQQGIQGITEDTAGALEAYMNGVSQQVYLHSDLLTQIRDTMVAWDMDVQLATQAQILLQLQASYQVQMSIQSTLVGWSNASGQAVRVEMI